MEPALADNVKEKEEIVEKVEKEIDVKYEIKKAIRDAGIEHYKIKPINLWGNRWRVNVYTRYMEKGRVLYTKAMPNSYFMVVNDEGVIEHCDPPID